MARLTHYERVALHWTVMLLPLIATLVASILLANVVQTFFTILAMFFLAWLLAFLLDPIVTWIVRRLPILPRGFTAAIVFVLIALLAVAALVAIASSVVVSARSIIGDTATVSEAVQRLIAPLQAQIESLGLQVDLAAATDDALSQLTGSADALLQQVLSTGLVLFTQGTAIIFIAVVMVANKGRFLRFGRRLVPEGRETLYDDIAAATSRSFGGFIRGQFGLSALYGLFVGIVAAIFGVEFAVLIAVLTALLQSIPYFGQLLSWIPLAATTLVFAPEVLVPVLIVLLIGLLVIQNIVSPRVMGTAVGMNPILVLAAVFVGAQVAGALGAVFGVPVAAVGATLFNAWLDQVRPPAAVDVDEKHEPLPSEGGARVAEEELELMDEPDPVATGADQTPRGAVKPAG